MLKSITNLIVRYMFLLIALLYFFNVSTNARQENKQAAQGKTVSVESLIHTNTAIISNGSVNKQRESIEKPGAVPNLFPYKPDGWSDKIVVSTITGTNTDSSPLNPTDYLFIDWAILNNSTVSAYNFYVALYVDGIEQYRWAFPELKALYLGYAVDYRLNPLSTGNHIIKIVADVTNSVSESNETDNEYERTITIGTTGTPDIKIVPPSLIINQPAASAVEDKSVYLGPTKLDSSLHIPKIPEKFIAGRYIDENGKEVEIMKIPGILPGNYRAPVAEYKKSSVVITNVPAYDWSFGCTATSAAMIAAYYDNNGYPNIYTGPTNGGVAPMDNSSWGQLTINGEVRKLCPLSATKNGLDGRTTRGHVDDYWIKYGNTDDDPYITNGWTQHTYGDCTGDFMRTNQSFYNNSDGSTTTYYYTNGSPYSANEVKDGGHGFQLFMESRGYTVTQRYNQLIYGYNGNNLGFTFNQFKQEINSGYPVLIHVLGHTMVGYGYDDNGSKIYIHDTWDYSNHEMTWGGSYSDMQQYEVTVLHLAPATGGNNAFAIQNQGTQTLIVSSISDNKGWLTTSGNPSTPFSISPSGSQNVTVNVDWSQITGTQDLGTISIASNDPDEPGVTVPVTAIKAAQAVVETPVISPGSGTFPPAINVTITCSTPLSEIRYTTNGSDPVSTSTLYTDPISINSPAYSGNVTIKARGFKSGMTQSNLATVTYIYNNSVSSSIKTISPESSSAGAEFYIDIKVGDPNTVTNLFGISLVLNYNKTYLTYVSAESASWFGDDLLFYPSNDAANGKVLIGISRKSPAAGVTGSGLVARVKFRSLLATPNNTVVNFNLSDLVANDPTGNSINLTPAPSNTIITTGLAIWPGDTNNDGIVNQADILPLGMYWNNTGSARTDASSNWIAQYCQPWTTNSATYADANGNGTVEQGDILPIGLNWNKTHTLLTKSNSGGTVLSGSGLILDKITRNKNEFLINFLPDLQNRNLQNITGISLVADYNLPDNNIDEVTINSGSYFSNSLLNYFRADKPDAKAALGAVDVYKTIKNVETNPVITIRLKVKDVNGSINFKITEINIVNSEGTVFKFKDCIVNLNITGIKEIESINSYSLIQNYPNPFNPTTSISYQLADYTFVNLKVYNMLGQEIQTLVNTKQSPGGYRVDFNASNLPSGVYFYKITTEKFSSLKKMVLQK